MSHKPKSHKKAQPTKGAMCIADCRKRMAAYSDEKRNVLNELFRALVLMKGIHA